LTIPSSGLKILSLDGGGVRGLSPLIILSMLQDKVNAMGCSEVPPCRIFDLIIGTSTGGIIAILLGRCGYTVAECIEIYKLFAKEIFNYSLLSKGARYTATNSRLPADTLVAKMETVIGDRFGDKRTLFATDPQNGCKV
jgi:patatin-like phospholipase/acyl hydrolase